MENARSRPGHAILGFLERERDWELRGEQSLFLVNFVISNSLEVDVSGVRYACSNDQLPKKHSFTHAIQNLSSFFRKKYLKLKKISNCFRHNKLSYILQILTFPFFKKNTLTHNSQTFPAYNTSVHAEGVNLCITQNKLNI